MRRTHRRALKVLTYCGQLFVLLFLGLQLSAQNCTVNAGIAREFCANDPVQLFGQSQGLGRPETINWSQVSGPSVLIDDPNTLMPMVIGVIGGNDYTFRLSQRKV